MVIYDRLIEGVVEGSECTEQEERDHWSENTEKAQRKGSPCLDFICSTITGNERDKRAMDERPVSLTSFDPRPTSRNRCVSIDRLSRYISYYLWSVLIRLESR